MKQYILLKNFLLFLEKIISTLGAAITHVPSFLLCVVDRKYHVRQYSSKTIHLKELTNCMTCPGPAEKAKCERIPGNLRKRKRRGATARLVMDATALCRITRWG